MAWNSQKLINAIKGKGYKLKEFTLVIGMDYSTFWRKVSNDRTNEFTRYEIKAIKNELGLAPEEVDSIFFE